VIWLIGFFIYEIATLVFWRQVFHDERMTVRQWALALALSWAVSPIAAIIILIVYIAEQR
jgi:hypothetical protein